MNKQPSTRSRSLLQLGKLTSSLSGVTSTAVTVPSHWVRRLPPTSFPPRWLPRLMIENASAAQLMIPNVLTSSQVSSVLPIQLTAIALNEPNAHHPLEGLFCPHQLSYPQSAL
jgi:hypothetical protein